MVCSAIECHPALNSIAAWSETALNSLISASEPQGNERLVDKESGYLLQQRFYVTERAFLNANNWFCW